MIPQFRRGDSWEFQGVLRVIPVQHLPQEYFKHFSMRFTCGDFTTSWQRLEKRLVNGYTILVNLLVAAMNLSVKTVEKPRRGALLGSASQLDPVMAFMNNLAITTKSFREGRWIPENLCKIAGAMMSLSHQNQGVLC